MQGYLREIDVKYISFPRKDIRRNEFWSFVLDYLHVKCVIILLVIEIIGYGTQEIKSTLIFSMKFRILHKKKMKSNSKINRLMTDIKTKSF